MPITFENDYDAIVYSLWCVIAHARRTQQIFVAQCVWWLVSIIGLEQVLVSYIDKLQNEENTIRQEQPPREVSAIPRDPTEDQRIDQVLDNTKQYLRDSRRLREIAALKISGQTGTGRNNPLGRIQKSLNKSKKISNKTTNDKRDYYSKTEGIDESEIQSRKTARKCLHCAWPSDRKGNHYVKDCRRQIKIDKGTAPFTKSNKYQRPVVSSEKSTFEDSSSSEDGDTTDSSDSQE